VVRGAFHGGRLRMLGLGISGTERGASHPNRRRSAAISSHIGESGVGSQGLVESPVAIVVVVVSGGLEVVVVPSGTVVSVGRVG
jgi:hypothetical protein